MKKITKIAACGLLATLGLTAMASCGEQNSLAKEVISKVLLTQDGEKVSSDFAIPRIVKHNDVEYEISWESSDTSVLDVIENSKTQFTADVKRPFGDNEAANVEIKLTASVSVDGKTAKNEFKATVECINANTALESAISNLGIKASYGAKEELDLPAKSNEYKDEISFEYSLGGTYTSTKLESNKLTLDPTLGQESVVVKVKATSGSTVVEKDVNTKTSLKTVYLTATEALAQPVDAMIYIQGKIKSVASDKYGNFWIEDEAGKEIEIYGLYKGLIENCYDAENKWLKKGIRYDAWEDFEKLAVGDYVYAYGTRAAYKETQEVSNCLLMGVVKDYPVSTVKEAKDTPKGDFVTVYGEVKSIASDKYGNLYLKDSEGNELYVYGLYTGKVSACYDAENKWISSNNPAVRYDKMTDAPKVGDVIAVYGPMDEYKGAQQIKNGLLLYYISKVERTSTEPDPEEPSTPDTPVAPTEPLTSATAKHSEAATTNIDKVSNPVTALGLNDYVFDVSFTACASGSYSNQPGLNKDGTIRLYNNTSGEGNTLTFTVIAGYKIDSIKVTFSSDSNGTLQVYTTTENILTAVEDVYTVNGNTVTLKNIATESSHQLRIVQIDFVLSQVA